MLPEKAADDGEDHPEEQPPLRTRHHFGELEAVGGGDHGKQPHLGQPAHGEAHPHETALAQHRRAEPGNHEIGRHDRRPGGRDASGRGHAGDHDEVDDADSEKDGQRCQRQSGHPQPEGDEQGAGGEHRQADPVRQDLLSVAGTAGPPQGPAHSLQVMARSPETEKGEGDYRPGSLVAEVGALEGLVHAHHLGAVDSQQVEDPLLDLAQEVEEPDAEGDLQADEVEESHPRRS